ncbi:MAG: hypothetical protein CVV27_18500 [Candidatus Melainabacteria bacterium HGW-Melainabacteria-1]|nr:MAG: hypothetical protein CVV27_18500 [Candidatus Melainabacteria bacterium HGW-Melainabacteria-1]
MTKLPPSSLRPPAELFGTPATKPTPKQPSKPALAKATPAKTTPGKVSSDIVTPGKVSPDTRSAIPLPQGKTQTHLPLISPTNQAIAAAKPKGQQLAPGVWFDSSGKTADGGVIRTISIDPRQAELVPIFNSSGPISARQLEKQPGLLAAINASFFGQGGIIGDIKADKKILSDDDRPYLDKITDQRHFLASTADGKVKTGRGGLSENQGFRHFIGGFPALYERSQLSALDQDIRSGVLAKRASYGGPQAMASNAPRA